MRKRIITGVVVLLLASPVALAVFPTIHAQIRSDRIKQLPAQSTPPGTSQATGFEIVTVGPFTNVSPVGQNAIVNCPAGKKAIGGGASASNYNATMNWSFPRNGTGWESAMRKEPGPPITVYFYAVCINAS